jgi:cell division transport system permease protein
MVWRYAWSRALSNLRRDWRSALGTTLMLTAVLCVLGMVGLLYVNVDHLGRVWLSNSSVSLFLKSDLDDAARQALLAQVKAHAAVQRAQLVTPKEGLQQLAERLGADHALMQGFDESALPYALDVEVTVDFRKRLGEVTRQLRALPGVEDVIYSERLLDRVQAFFTAVQWVGAGLMGLVGLAFWLIVAQGTRLALYARRDEVEILDLIGATRRWIRSSYVLEGAVIGGAAWLLALALVAASYRAMQQGLAASPLSVWLQGETVFLPWPAWAGAGALAALLAGLSAGWSVTRLLRETAL